MPLSSIQQGLIVQFEYAKFLMMGSGGRLELAVPMTDDERRDYEIHIRGRYGLGLANQIKSSTRLHRMSKNARNLYILFDVRAERLVSSPFFWYFFAYLDPKLMGLSVPTFLIPSTDFHELAAPRLRNGVWVLHDGRQYGAESARPLAPVPRPDHRPRTARSGNPRRSAQISGGTGPAVRAVQDAWCRSPETTAIGVPKSSWRRPILLRTHDRREAKELQEISDSRSAGFVTRGPVVTN